MKILLTLTVIAFSSFSAMSATYEVVDLGTLGGSHSKALSINNNGQIVGWAQNNSGTQHAFLYSGGLMQDLDNLPNSYASVANDINNLGQVVGSTYIANPNGQHVGFHAFLYSNGSIQDIYSIGYFRSANGINDLGQIVGESGQSYYKYTYGDSWTILPPLIGTNNSSTGNAINNLGQIAFDSTIHDGISSYTFLIGTSILAINDNGSVVGSLSYGPTGFVKAFLYSNGSTIDLGMLNGGNNSGAFGLNNLGQVVGWAQVGQVPSNGYFEQHSFLYSDGAMQDLETLVGPDSGWKFNEARDINDLGQIVGYGINPDGYNRAFLLNPIPEPSALSFLIVSSILLTSRKRRG